MLDMGHMARREVLMQSMTLEEWASYLNRKSVSCTDLVAYGLTHGATAICFYKRKGTWKVSIKGHSLPTVEEMAAPYAKEFDKIRNRYGKD
jgi:hypothetical protein